MIANHLFGFSQAFLLPGGRLAGFFMIRTVVELDNEFRQAFIVGFQFQRLCRVDDKETLLALLDVIVLTLCGSGQAEVHLQRAGLCGLEVEAALLALFLGLCRAEVEGEVAQRFARLDVVLVFVGPVQHDFAAVIRHGIGGGATVVLGDEVALGHEVAFVVVAAEEAVQVLVDLGIVRQHAAAVAGLLLGEFEFLADLGTAILGFQFTRGQEGIFAECFSDLDPSGFERVVGVALRLLGKVGIDLAAQFGIDKGLYLGATGVKDAVQAKVELGLVELEQFAQQGDELVFLLVHGYVSIKVRRRPGIRCCRASEAASAWDE